MGTSEKSSSLKSTSIVALKRQRENQSLQDPAQSASEIFYSLYYLLHGWNCPRSLREYVFAIFTYTKGKMQPIPDKEMSMMLGRSRNHVSLLRKTLEAWQSEIKYSVIKVKENEYQPKKKKYNPTEYCFMMNQLLIQIIDEARSLSVYGSDWRKAIREAIETMCDSSNELPSYHHRKPRRVRDENDVDKTLWKMFRNLSAKLLEHGRKLGIEPTERVEDMQAEVEIAFSEMLLKEPRKDKRDDSIQTRSANRQRAASAAQDDFDSYERFADDFTTLADSLRKQPASNLGTENKRGIPKTDSKSPDAIKRKRE